MAHFVEVRQLLLLLIIVFLQFGELGFTTQDARIVLDVILKDRLSLMMVDIHEAIPVICSHLSAEHLTDFVFEYLIHLRTHVLKGF